MRLRPLGVFGLVCGVGSASVGCGADKNPDVETNESGGTSGGAGAPVSGAGGGGAGAAAGAGSGGTAGTGGTGGAAGRGGSAGTGGSGGKAGAGSGGAAAGAAGSAGCQLFDLEVGDTGEHGLKLLYRATIASFLTGLGFLDGYFYWRGSPTIGDDETLIRVSLASDEVEVLGALPATATILAGDQLIWMETSLQAPDLSMAELKTAPVSDVAAATTLATVRTSLFLTADAENVYFSVSEPDELYSVPRTGGAPKLLVEGRRTQSLTPIGDHLYYLDVTEQELRRVPRGGGDSELVASAGLPNGGIGDADGFYWYESGDRSIEYFSFDGDAAITVASELRDQPFDMALIGGDLFWDHGSSCGVLARLNAARNGEEPVVSGFNGVSWIGANADRLYVTDVESVYRLDK